MKLLLVFLGLIVAETSCLDKLLLTVYYESKCSDSRIFLEEQLAPTMNKMSGHLQLQLVPFGKAKSINQGESFECQHGPTECRGNMVQDCALHLMGDRSDVDKLSYVNCEMQSLAGTTGDLQCVREADLPDEDVQECLSSEQGRMLQLRSETLTNEVSPSFIPTITVNGHFDQQIQDSAQKNLFLTICTLMPGAEPCVAVNFIIKILAIIM